MTNKKSDYREYYLVAKFVTKGNLQIPDAEYHIAKLLEQNLGNEVEIQLCQLGPLIDNSM